MYFYLSKILAPILNPINTLIIIYVILIIINLKYKKKSIRIFSNFIIFIFLFISLFPIGRLGITYLEKDYVNQNKINNIENIIVLGGAEDIFRTKQFGKLHLNSDSERLISVINISKKNPLANIFYLGGNGNLNQDIEINETDVAKQFFQIVGFDITKIQFIGNTRNTIENFQKLKAKYDIENRKNLLITSASHMKRSLIISKHLGYDLIPYAVDFKTQPKLKPSNYYQSFNVLPNLGSFNVFFRECLGIIAFKILY